MIIAKIVFIEKLGFNNVRTFKRYVAEIWHLINHRRKHYNIEEQEFIIAHLAKKKLPVSR
jgi:hypothetical protein